MLLEELNHAQSGDDQAMLNLISKFLPLIKKYGRRLGYEDAANDLIADFIEFISEWNLNNFHQSSDGAAVKYIAQSLSHIYLKRLKFQIEIEPKCISMEELTPGQLNVLSAKTATWDKYTLSTVIPDGLLTPREFFILSEIYEGFIENLVVFYLENSGHKITLYTKRWFALANHFFLCYNIFRYFSIFGGFLLTLNQYLL